MLTIFIQNEKGNNLGVGRKPMSGPWNRSGSRQRVKYKRHTEACVAINEHTKARS